ncbi:hypothetical protein AURDEDRAFT_168361 [Auricularia subglabra TFB-10046 SS5]|nr:hypothetical protein AURDEDRAFT_168361 [Auricularia subglabra TFB-10046 SS5]
MRCIPDIAAVKEAHGYILYEIRQWVEKVQPADNLEGYAQLLHETINILRSHENCEEAPNLYFQNADIAALLSLLQHDTSLATAVNRLRDFLNVKQGASGAVGGTHIMPILNYGALSFVTCNFNQRLSLVNLLKISGKRTTY